MAVGRRDSGTVEPFDVYLIARRQNIAFEKARRGDYVAPAGVLAQLAFELFVEAAVFGHSRGGHESALAVLFAKPPAAFSEEVKDVGDWLGGDWDSSARFVELVAEFEVSEAGIDLDELEQDGRQVLSVWEDRQRAEINAGPEDAEKRLRPIIVAGLALGMKHPELVEVLYENWEAPESLGQFRNRAFPEMDAFIMEHHPDLSAVLEGRVPPDVEPHEPRE